MNPRLRGFQFPELGVKGDPSTLDAIARRTPNIAGGGVTHASGGVILTPPRYRGGGASTKLGALEPATSIPAHIAAPTGSQPNNSIRVWFTFGTINSRKATNMLDKFDISTPKDLYAEISFTTTGPFAVTSWKIVAQAPSFTPPTITTPRPAKGYFLLGSVLAAGDGLSLQSSGSGSISVWPQISNSLTGDKADSTIVYSRH